MSSAIPVVSTLASLAELTAKLVAAKDTAEVALLLGRSVKWIMPVDRVALVVPQRGELVMLPGERAIVPTGALAHVLTRKSAVLVEAPEVGELIGDPALRAVMIMPLAIENEMGAMILGTREKAVLGGLDRGMCHILAHNVSSALRSVRLLERERVARELAEMAMRARDHMIQTVTHDLRNPLGVVMSLVGLVLDDNPDAIPIEDAEAIDASLRRMKGLIDEMLDIAKTGGGAIELRRKRADLTPLLAEAARSARYLLKGHTLDVELASDAFVGDFDEPRIARVLGNLISNAVKYSPHGGTIGFHARRDEGALEVRVTDSGIGIPAADLPKVFTKFHRAANVGTIGGNGIGLAGSRDIVIGHGGTLTVESVEGQGSTFILRLPLVA